MIGGKILKMKTMRGTRIALERCSKGAVKEPALRWKGAVKEPALRWNEYDTETIVDSWPADRTDGRGGGTDAAAGGFAAEHL
jgi:hypothetical protein